MSTNKDSVSERVKKLLRLAGCKAATPAEAANALNRAMELIERHEIDVASLDLDEQTERVVCERIRVGSRVSFIKKRVANILSRYFKVRVIIASPDLAVVGFESDVGMAGYVFHFLVGACSRSVSDWAALERKHRRKVSQSKKVNYITGWFYGLAENLRKPDLASQALDDSKTALVLAGRQKKVDSAYDEMFPNRKTLSNPESRKNWQIITAGYRDGKNTSIAQPLTNAQQGTLLLT